MRAKRVGLRDVMGGRGGGGESPPIGLSPRPGSPAPPSVPLRLLETPPMRLPPASRSTRAGATIPCPIVLQRHSPRSRLWYRAVSSHARRPLLRPVAKSGSAPPRQGAAWISDRGRPREGRGRKKPPNPPRDSSNSAIGVVGARTRRGGCSRSDACCGRLLPRSSRHGPPVPRGEHEGVPRRAPRGRGQAPARYRDPPSHPVALAPGPPLRPSVLPPPQRPRALFGPPARPRPPRRPLRSSCPAAAPAPSPSALLPGRGPCSPCRPFRARPGRRPRGPLGLPRTCSGLMRRALGRWAGNGRVQCLRRRARVQR